MRADARPTSCYTRDVPRLPGLLVATLLLGACSCNRPPARETSAATADDARGGEQLYRTYCSLCHADDGKGYASDNANSLRNPDFLAVATTEFLREAIANGRTDTPMSAYSRLRGGPLEADEVDTLVAYIESWREGSPEDVHGQTVTGVAARGLSIYTQRCASCHGPRGQGVTAVSLDNPRFLDTVSDGYLLRSIAKGRRGTPMPGFEDELSAAQLGDLVALIRSWGEPPAGPSAGRDPETPRVASIAVDELIINPDGEQARFELRDDMYVPADVLKEALDQGRRMILLDARPTSDWLQFRIPGALPSPFYDIEAIVERLPQDGTMIVAYCGCPHAASGRVIRDLRGRGFEHTAVLDEGVFVWRERGYPIVEGDGTE